MKRSQEMGWQKDTSGIPNGEKWKRRGLATSHCFAGGKDVSLCGEATRDTGEKMRRSGGLFVCLSCHGALTGIQWL
jgi:hypothetical protein